MKGKKLNESLLAFNHAMEKRLTEKQSDGFSGWDADDFDSFNIPMRLVRKANKVAGGKENCAKKDLVDIANFAMFLWTKM